MKDLFTVCITHYNQMKYIFTAIDSVLKQNYPNIELIIADDGSSFNKEKVEKYIKKNKKDNIKNVVVLTKEKNVGTVRNVNSALKIATGKYITFFAADDQLADSKVISNYYKAFKEHKKLVITAQAFLYDHELKVNNGAYVVVKNALKYNEMRPRDVFYYMAQSCFYASGATAYDMMVFKKYGIFDEQYLLVEDWSYYLHLLKNDVSIYFVDFKALNHRDGGVSHNYKITPVVKKYHLDILKITENELLVDMPEISNAKKLEIYNKCKWNVSYICELLQLDKQDYYDALIDEAIKKNIGGRLAILSIMVPSKIYNFFKWHIYYKIKNLNRNNHKIVIGILYWFLINATYLNNYYLNNTPEMKVLLLASSLIGSCIVARFIVGLADLIEYCLPLTLLLIAYSKVLTTGNIINIMLLFLLIYFIVFYILYVFRILINKLKSLK